MNGIFRLSIRTVLLIRFSVIGLVLLVFTISCTTNQKQPVVVNPDLYQTRTDEKQSQANKVEQRILEEYRRWRDTRRRLDTSSSQGIDCSGFVKAVYKDAFNIDIPGTTKAQVRRGISVSFNELQPGDLIFFKPPDYPRHVGIFLSRSQFVHASRTKGVTISKIDSHYWVKYYWTARRILPVTEN